MSEARSLIAELLRLNWPSEMAEIHGRIENHLLAAGLDDRKRLGLLSELDTEAQRATVLNPNFSTVATYIADVRQRVEISKILDRASRLGPKRSAVCGSDATGQQAGGSRSKVITSAIADSAHHKIDANDRTQTLRIG